MCCSDNLNRQPIADIRLLGETRCVDSSGLSDRLNSPSVEDRIAATYGLNYDDFRDPKIRTSVRANLASDNSDLVEITIMRLLIRGKDARSAPQVRGLLKAGLDDLVFCAAVTALTNLARDRPETASATLRELEALSGESVPPDRGGLLAKSIAEVRRMLG
jgi:hypothetical protein